jgi:hypothetical protein
MRAFKLHFRLCDDACRGDAGGGYRRRDCFCFGSWTTVGKSLSKHSGWQGDGRFHFSEDVQLGSQAKDRLRLNEVIRLLVAFNRKVNPAEK